MFVGIGCVLSPSLKYRKLEKNLIFNFDNGTDGSFTFILKLKILMNKIVLCYTFLRRRQHMHEYSVLLIGLHTFKGFNVGRFNAILKKLKCYV